jgi:hypothetical protein
VSALVDNFRTGSFAAGFLPLADLPWPPGEEDDYVRWDVSPPSSAGTQGVRDTDDPFDIDGPVVQRVRGKVSARTFLARYPSDPA